ncbi:MAG: hypothetical protein Q7J54_04110 [Candidatus Woesearchaeota archaeon]|nr:hypothetical protein [Candidatus Woesearchaeota archaeon]
MPKPIAQRGFKIKAGDISTNFMEYSISGTGMETLHLYAAEKRSGIIINLDEGSVESILISTPEITTRIGIDDVDCMKSDLPQQAVQRSMQQAREIYNCALKFLNIEERLKEYQPRFSHLLEINPLNVLGIEKIEDFIDKIK